MKNLLLLVFFLIYTTTTFFISNPFILISFICINIFLSVVLKVSFKRMILNIYKFSFVIFITFIFNTLLGYFKYAISISFKLLIVCNTTFIFTYKMGSTNILIAIEKLFTPLKLIGISPSDISLIINIAITSIPIFIKNINQTLLAMQNKGLKKYSIISLKYTFKILLSSLFKKTSEMELTLKSKNYIE